MEGKISGDPTDFPAVVPTPKAKIQNLNLHVGLLPRWDRPTCLPLESLCRVPIALEWVGQSSRIYSPYVPDARTQPRLGSHLAHKSVTKTIIAGFLGYPQPGGGTHPPIPREGVLGKVLGDWANLALSQAHKNTRSRVVRAAGA